MYLVDRSGGFVDVAETHCASDVAAVGYARRHLSRSAAVEIWQQARFVKRLSTKPSSAHPAT
jgi:hypothetical protein